MPHPLVLNIRTASLAQAKQAIYIGRRTSTSSGYFGNPFSHLVTSSAEFRVKTRDEACDKFEIWCWERMLAEKEFREKVLSLEGKYLLCWCAPTRCHGESYIKLIQRWKENCCICHKNWVNTEEGFDTCESCSNNI